MNRWLHRLSQLLKLHIPASEVLPPLQPTPRRPQTAEPRRELQLQGQVGPQRTPGLPHYLLQRRHFDYLVASRISQARRILSTCMRIISAPANPIDRAPAR
jgi:hypothetical protein